jgi:hypothetical protein
MKLNKICGRIELYKTSVYKTNYTIVNFNRYFLYIILNTDWHSYWYTANKAVRCLIWIKSSWLLFRKSFAIIICIRHYCPWRTAKLKPIFHAYGPWTGRGPCCATPAAILGLNFGVLSDVPPSPSFSKLFRQMGVEGLL